MLNLEEFRNYCLAKKGVTEHLPFGPDTLVFKVIDKMFALTGLENEEFRINLKYDSGKMEELRARYPAITPGYHMNKNNWNTILIDGSISKKELLKLIDHSYDRVVEGLSKSNRTLLNEM